MKIFESGKVSTQLNTVRQIWKMLRKHEKNARNLLRTLYAWCTKKSKFALIYPKRFISFFGASWNLFFLQQLLPLHRSMNDDTCDIVLKLRVKTFETASWINKNRRRKNREMHHKPFKETFTTFRAFKFVLLKRVVHFVAKHLR